jgi:glutathione-specific gamma-glutamylcyclotransferase
VYLETVRPVVLLTRPERRVRAVCFVVDRGHPQYAGRLDLATQLHHVRQGHGQSGPNREYVLSTVKELEALGCRDVELHLLAERLHGIHEAHPAAKGSHRSAGP